MHRCSRCKLTLTLTLIDDLVVVDRAAVSQWLVVAVGSIRLLGPLRGPKQHELTVQMEVRSRRGVVMSRHIAHVVIHVSAYRF